MKNKYLIAIFVLIANAWFWRIFDHNFIFIIFLLSIVLLYFRLSIIDNSKYMQPICALLFLSFSFYLLKSNFDMSVLTPNQIEISNLNRRRSYYPIFLGRIFQNKITLAITKYQKNLFEGLDPNIYFFAGHPRERSGILEFEKFNPIYILPFLTGFYMIIKNKNRALLQLFLIITILNGFSNQNYYLGPILFFPFIAVVSAIGCLEIVGSLNKCLLKMHEN